METGKKKIRVIDTGSLSAAQNMCLDETLLQARDEGLIPDTIRFLSFYPRSALTGYFQTIENEIRTDFCSQNGIDINRRITGGGALYWDEKDIGWEIFSCFSNFKRGFDTIENFYKFFCSAVSGGLNDFGLDSRYRPRNDIEVNGRKISGSGGTSLKNAFMFQGTLLVDTDIELMLKVLKVPVEKLSYREMDSLKKRITWLSRELGYLPSREQIINNILNGFCRVLEVDFYFDELSKKEKDIFKSRISHFTSQRHIHKIKEKKSYFFIKSINKTPKGTIKCNAYLNMKKNILKNIIFTGDFFLYPQRVILDLESLLKNIPFRREKLAELISGFFLSYPCQINGVSAGDIIKAVEGCLVKIELEKNKVPLKHLNDLFLVNTTGRAGNKIKTLLLPYCAKKPGCKFRLKDGCSFCGKCSFGDAVTYADAAGIKNITITSYRNLKRVLQTLKNNGEGFFAGCCCEAFYIKHQEDFEKIGIPGILVNISNSTCYDLGKEKAAYEGEFQGFTQVKMTLLKKILKIYS